MNKEIRDRWVAALRSGTYKQGTGKLRRQTGIGDTFCCLGVLCDIAQKDGVDHVRWNPDTKAYQWADEDGSRGRTTDFLPAPVITWAGLTSRGLRPQDPAVTVGDSHYALSQLNDLGTERKENEDQDTPPPRWTFSQIADVIEEQL